MSGRVARDLTTKNARAANYDGPSLSIGPSDNSLARMNVRNGSDALHLDPQNCEIWRFSGFRPDTQTHNVTAPNPYSVWVGRSSEKRLKSRKINKLSRETKSRIFEIQLKMTLEISNAGSQSGPILTSMRAQL